MNQVKSKDSIGKLGSDLLEAVGGLEAARAIVNDAPEGADFTAVLKSESHYFRECEGRILTDGFECWQDSGYSDFDKLKLEYEGFNWFHLSDLRTAIAQAGSDFMIGDQVVFTDDFMHDEIMTVSGFFQNEIELDDGSKRVHVLDMLRAATLEEVAAGHRIDEPTHGESTSDELGQRPLPQILVRPDEAEILPQCTACATKDHDLKALRKLQGSNLSIYAGRVHSQQTHILIYEVVIGVLIFACIALFLWGLK